MLLHSLQFTVLLLTALLLVSLTGCSEDGSAPRDTAVETIVDRGIIEGPTTQPVVDAFVPRDGPVEATTGQDVVAVADAGPG